VEREASNLVTQPTPAEFLDAYAGVRLRFRELLRDRDGAPPIPACPGWSSRDLLAHLVGLCEDWVDGRLDGYASAAWTADQLGRYTNLTTTDLLDRWDGAATAFAKLGDDPQLGPPARWAFGDAVIHEADARGALAAGRVPPDAVMLALQGTIGRWRQTIAPIDPPTTLIVRPPDAREWKLGPPNDNEPVIVKPSAYELFRALAGRRTLDQVRGWDWSADPEPFLSLGLPYPFTWAETPLAD
jgi:uncharacterized protein (TIGR03083 family)